MEPTSGIEPLKRLACNGCDRSFPSADPHAMLEAIKGPCPDCGGRFGLAEPRRDEPPADAARA